MYVKDFLVYFYLCCELYVNNDKKFRECEIKKKQLLSKSSKEDLIRFYNHIQVHLNSLVFESQMYEDIIKNHSNIKISDSKYINYLTERLNTLNKQVDYYTETLNQIKEELHYDTVYNFGRKIKL